MNPPPALPSYLEPAGVGSRGVFLQQVDRATSSLGELAYRIETLKRPKRILIVDVPIRYHHEQRLQRPVGDGAAGAGVTLRTAAFTVACRRILEAWHIRGLYP